MANSLLHSSVASSTKSFVRVASTTKSFAKSQIHHFSTKYVVTPLTLFMGWLTIHTHIAYLVLFLGAYFESLVGPSFFIPGELFLLSGSILAGTHVLNIWLVMAVLYGGAILGDTSSYWIGRAIGKSIFHERKKILNLTNYRKIESMLEKYGPSGIFFARLVGPFSKIAPVAAGIFEVPFGTFLFYNIPGVLVGCGEFIAAGYFFGNRYEIVLWIVERYSLLIVLLLAGAFCIYLYFKKHSAARSHHKKDAEKHSV
jgi:membrane-associated protein